jgi:ABC-2 type transport system ATP-binding protein
MIAVHDLTRNFGKLKAVDNLSFEAKAGEIFALLGPNGAGKTTTIKMILGMLKPDRGTIMFDGSEVWIESNEYKARVGYVPESCALYENLKGYEYLEFVGNLHHIPADIIREKSETLLRLFELDKDSSRLIREYSKGMKQKILIISAIMHDPDLIILDEPFSGLDANAVSVFKEIFREQANQGKAIIFCSHVLDVVERLVDRALIIKNGKKLVAGTPEEIMRQSGHESLDKAFNKLTGATDIDTRAREIIQAIGNSKEDKSDEKQ